MKYSEEEINSLRKEIEKTSNKLTPGLIGLRLDGISSEGIVLGLLKLAAFIAKKTGCKQDTFSTLAKIAFSVPDKTISKDLEKDDIKFN